MKSSKKEPKKQPRADTKRRSPCPVACSLDILGDRWTMLVVRDLFLGRTRFKEFCESPENIPTNILTDRLDRLVENQIAEKVPLEEGAKRMSYQLTDKGQALKPVLMSLTKWGLKWEKDTKIGMQPKK